VIIGEFNEAMHNTWEKLKAVRLAVQTFLPHLVGRNVLLHEVNQAICCILAGLTSRSPTLMTELSKVWHLLYASGVNVIARYIRPAANV
jgi:hypothetical protein